MMYDYDPFLSDAPTNLRPIHSGPWFPVGRQNHAIHGGRVWSPVGGESLKRDRRWRALPEPPPRTPDERTFGEMTMTDGPHPG